MTMNIKELNKAIDEVNGSAAKLADRYQEVGLLCLTHLQAHGDVGPCNRLYLGMPKSTRRLAMGQWMVKFGKVKPNADRNTLKTMPLVYDKAKDGDMEGAAATKWYEVSNEREITDVFDLQVAVKSLLNRAKDKTIKVAGTPMSPDAAKQTLKAIALLAGLPVPNVEVDDKGVTHMPVDGKVGDTVPMTDEAKKAAQAAADAAIAAAAGKGGKADAEGPSVGALEEAPAARTKRGAKPDAKRGSKATANKTERKGRATA